MISDYLGMSSCKARGVVLDLEGAGTEMNFYNDRSVVGFTFAQVLLFHAVHVCKWQLFLDPSGA